MKQQGPWQVIESHTESIMARGFAFAMTTRFVNLTDIWEYIKLFVNLKLGGTVLAVDEDDNAYYVAEGFSTWRR